MRPEFTQFSPKLIELSKSKVYYVGHSENWRLKEYVKRYFPRLYDNQNITTAYPPIGIHLQAILGKYLPPGFYTTGPCWISKRCDSGIIIKPERVFDSCFSFPLIFFLPSINIISKNPLHASQYLIVKRSSEICRIREEETNQGREYKEWLTFEERKELLFLNLLRSQSFTLKYISAREIGCK